MQNAEQRETPAGEELDYVVVGGGSAGCIVAAELARDRATRVLLLEGGDAADANPETLLADGYKDAFVNERLMYERFSVPQAACGGRRWFLGSGRGMGGSGAVNAMVYTRGAREDYEEWPVGWRWDDVVPAFEALERVLRVRRREPTRFTESCVAAAEEAGFRRKEDLNDGDLSGVLGYEWMNFDGAERRSSYVSFLRALGARANLEVWTGTRALRVLFRERRAVGVEYRRRMRDGSLRVGRVAVRGEVVCTAGALETPRLLMLSGVGPGAWLRAAGIPTVADAPAVGRNLHDHPNVQLFFLGKRRVDCLYPELYGFHRAGAGRHLCAGQSDSCYVFYPGPSSFKEGVVKLLPAMVLPERLYALRPLVAGLRGALAAVFGSPLARAVVRQLWGIVVILGKPRSRGTLCVTCPDPEAPAAIDPCYFSHRDDLETVVRGVGLARRMAATASARAMGAFELMPGARVRDDAAVAEFVKDNAMTTYHYAGTCALGDDGAVDGALRLRGVEGVRVADASVIPTTPVAALNAPSMMIGLRAAGLVRQGR